MAKRAKPEEIVAECGRRRAGFTRPERGRSDRRDRRDRGRCQPLMEFGVIEGAPFQEYPADPLHWAPACCLPSRHGRHLEGAGPDMVAFESPEMRVPLG